MIPKCIISILTLADLADILLLENKSQSFSWSAAQLESSLMRSDAVCLGVKQQGVLQGYILGGSVLNEAEIWNFAVLPHYRRQGIGTLLLTQLICFFEKRGVKAIYLEVRCSNHAAIALYQKVGFLEIDQRKNYYETKTGREDALFMCCESLCALRQGSGRTGLT